MDHWKFITVMVTVFTFTVEIRPMDSFLTAYLTGPFVNVTLNEVYKRLLTHTPTHILSINAHKYRAFATLKKTNTPTIIVYILVKSIYNPMFEMFSMPIRNKKKYV